MIRGLQDLRKIMKKRIAFGIASAYRVACAQRIPQRTHARSDARKGCRTLRKEGFKEFLRKS